MANTYDVGDVVHLTSEFTQNDVPFDPSTVSLKVTRPDGTQASYSYAGSTVTKDSTGNYHVDIAITMRGTYRYRWFSTGAGAAAEESWFQVRSQRVA